MEYFPLVQRFESALWISLVCHGQSRERFQRSLGWDYGVSNYRYSDHRHQIYVEDSRRLAQLIAAQPVPDRYNHFRQRCEAACRKLMAVAEEVRVAFDPCASRREMYLLFERMLEASMDAMPFLPSLVLIQNELELDLRSALSDDLGLAPDTPEFGMFWQRALIAEEQASFVPETREVLRMAGAYRSEGLDLALAHGGLPPQWQEQLDRHVDRFGWLGTFTYLNEPYSKSDILRRVQGAASGARNGLAETLERSERQLADAARAADELSSAQAKTLLAVARAFMHLRFERVDVHFKAEVQTRPVQERLAELAEIDRVQLVMLTLEELRAWALDDQPLPVRDELDLRVRNGIEYRIEDLQHRWSVAEPLRRLVDPDVRAQAPSGIVGDSACLGRAVGRIKHVTGVADMVGFDEGDVLLSPMTTPDVMYAIERASAIVTDEGGVLCHAAIISRELNKPCVIACETATRAFCDGDLVELEATPNGGIVRLVDTAA